MLSAKTMGHGSIQIATAEAGRLKIVLPYHPSRVATIKRVKGCQWHPEGRYWTVPRTDEAVSHLLTLFAGEPVEVNSSLRPANVSCTRQPSHEPAGDQPVATTIKLLDQVRQ